MGSDRIEKRAPLLVAVRHRGARRRGRHVADRAHVRRVDEHVAERRSNETPPWCRRPSDREDQRGLSPGVNAPACTCRRSSTIAPASGVRVVSSSREIDTGQWRGFRGNGCVGHASSPGTSPGGTDFLHRDGLAGHPVEDEEQPIFVIWATAGIRRPLRTALSEAGALHVVIEDVDARADSATAASRWQRRVPGHAGVEVRTRSAAAEETVGRIAGPGTPGRAACPRDQALDSVRPIFPAVGPRCRHSARPVGARCGSARSVCQ